MKNISIFFVNTILITLITTTVLPTSGSPLHEIVSKFNNSSVNSIDFKLQNAKNNLNCDLIEYNLTDVNFLENNDLILTANNYTVNSTRYWKIGRSVFICISKLECAFGKFGFGIDEYRILPNNSAIIYDDIIAEENYQIKGERLLICVPEDVNEKPLQKAANYIQKIGSIISVIALIIHLSAYIYMPSLRNWPGHNLASLSIAFLLGFISDLIGQIPEVLDVACVIAAIIQQYFFLAVIFWMNAMAIDVWLTMKRTKSNLIFDKPNNHIKYFAWYSLYAWGVPLLITSISVIFDNADGIPGNMKPNYGKSDTCWFQNGLPKIIFFSVPAFTLIVTNVIFFIMSAFLISRNSKNFSKDNYNFLLYVRLAVMMGIVWLWGLLAFAANNDVLWLLSDLFVNLQGLFVLLLFTCTKRTSRKVSEKISFIKSSSSGKSSSSEKTSVLSNYITTVSSKIESR